MDANSNARQRPAANQRVQVLYFKTVSRLLPHYFSVDHADIHTHWDAEVGANVTSVDLGAMFWRSILDTHKLRDLLRTREVDAEESDLVQRQFDDATVSALPKALATLGSVRERVPDPRDLWSAFHVVSRATDIASGLLADELDAHLARGLVSTGFRQYDLESILDSVEANPNIPLVVTIQRLCERAIAEINGPDWLIPTVVVINLRNDGEIAQVLSVASFFKRQRINATIVLDASGSNEQFSFKSWTDAFLAQRARVGKWINYFLPQQDYKASLKRVISSLAAAKRPSQESVSGLVELAPAPFPPESDAVPAKSVDAAFSDYISNLPTFKVAGLKTVVARLLPTRCHWSACTFCTINSQHPLPRGKVYMDLNDLGHMNALLDVLERDQVESVILTDEALHPTVLNTFASAVLRRDLRFVYRARARFTDEFTQELCDQLYASGCRYLGLGLEAASPRVNLIVNKHRGASPNYLHILANLENAGVRPHVYAILGFPTETLEEISATSTLLASAIRNSKYVTTSPNLFYLMRGSKMAAEPDKYGIKLLPTDTMALVHNFTEEQWSHNRSYASECVSALHRLQFSPDVENSTEAESYWHFIDQTGIFYLEKVNYSNNPYRQLAADAARISGDEIRTGLLLEGELFELEGASQDGSLLLCDWVTNNYARIDERFRSVISAILSGYDSREAVQLVEPQLREDAVHLVTALCQSRMLSPRREVNHLEERHGYYAGTH
ncbi:MAG: radical SAM protein [Armatimonadota bacterium]